MVCNWIFHLGPQLDISKGANLNSMLGIAPFAVSDIFRPKISGSFQTGRAAYFAFLQHQNSTLNINQSAALQSLTLAATASI